MVTLFCATMSFFMTTAQFAMLGTQLGTQVYFLDEAMLI
jgi:hypothetical protein